MLVLYHAVKVGICALGSGLGRTGGVQVYVRELIQAVVREAPAGIAWTVVVGSEDEMPPVAGPAVSLVRLPSHMSSRFARRVAVLAELVPGMPRPPDALARALDDLGLDLLHFPATRVRPFPRTTPFVVTMFDLQERFFPGFFSWRERLARHADNRRATAGALGVIAPTAFTAATLRRAYRVQSDRLSVVPVGVGDRFREDAERGERDRLRERYGLPEAFALYPANPWPHKNHARLFEAVGIAGQRLGRSLPVVCTGRLTGEGRSVSDIAAAAGLPPGQVLDLGFVEEPDIPGLYRQARLLVFPSLFEGYGMPILEAMACGCPVVASAASCLPEVGADAARFFDPTDVRDMAEAMCDVWAEGRLRQELVQAGLRRAQGLRWRSVVPALMAAYEKALHGRSAPATSPGRAT